MQITEFILKKIKHKNKEDVIAPFLLIKIFKRDRSIT